MLLAGCGNAQSGRPGQSAQGATPPRLDLGVVGISAGIGGEEVLSSGFVVDGDRGLIVTTAHGVWGARSLKLATAFGVLHGRIVARAPCDDLALLETHPRIPGLEPLPTAPAGATADDDQLLRAVGRRWSESATAGIASIPVRATGAERLDSPLVPEVSGGACGRSGRAADRHGAGRRRGARADGAVGLDRGPDRRAAAGPRRVFVGWADQYRCVGRQHALARAAHPGFRPADARLNAPVAPDAPARR